MWKATSVCKSMRRNVCIVILATVALWGCTGKGGADIAPAAICWDAATNGTSTRAYPDGFGAYPNYAGCTFGAYAMLTEPLWNASSTCVPYVDNQEVSYSEAETAWTTRGTYYWPQEGYLHFAAYSPYKTLNPPVTASSLVSFTSANKNKGIVISNFDVPTDIDDQTFVTREVNAETHETEVVSYDYDLMISDGVDCDYDCAQTVTNGYRPTLVGGGTTPVSLYGSGYKIGVHTRFKHIMTKLTFRFRMQTTDLGFQDQRIYIKSIVLKNLYSRGTYTSGDTYADGAWTYPAIPVQSDGTLVSYTNEEISNFEAPVIHCRKEGDVLVSDPVTVVDNYFALPQTLTESDSAPYGQQIEITYVVFTINGGYYIWDRTVTVPAVFLRTDAVPAWERGTNVTYTVALAPAQDMITFDVSWDEWPGPSGWNTFTITDK